MWTHAVSVPSASVNTVRRRDHTRRKPTTSVVPVIVVPLRIGPSDGELGGAHEPGHVPTGVPGPVEAHRVRVLPGEVLGVAQQRRRAHPAVRARPRRSGPGTAPGTRRSRLTARRSPADRASRGRRGRSPLVGRGLALETDLARALGVEDDQPDAQASHPRRRHGSARHRAGGGRRPRCPGHPTCSPRPRPRRRARRSRRTDGSRPGRRRTGRVARGGPRPHPARRARSVSVSASTMAPRSWSRTWSPRSAISRATARMASDADRSSGGDAGAEEPREHRHPRRRVGRSCRSSRRGPAPAGPGSHRRAAPRPGRRPARPGCPRTRRRDRRGRRPGTSRRLAQGEQDDLRVGRQPVDGPVRILDRAGSRRRPSRARSRRPGPAHRRHGRLGPRRGGPARRRSGPGCTTTRPRRPRRARSARRTRRGRHRGRRPGSRSASGQAYDRAGRRVEGEGRASRPGGRRAGWSGSATRARSVDRSRAGA